MKKQVIFNLPVKDLNQSKAFFAALGFSFDPQISGDKAAMVIIVEDSLCAMLTTESFFQSLINKPVVNAKE
ncbi:MAG: glyoxalase/bleomycin resistance/extradiol dioxygenase family protein, partial [Paludibacterium sp.]|nr:glyoxalase/bleomycin resistance/extradiol dioxygenase family protein [Paludibacterium sp.]